MSKIFNLNFDFREKIYFKKTVYIAINIDQDADLDTLPVPRVAIV